MAHFISAISKMLNWNHAQRPPRQRLRSSRIGGSYSYAALFNPECSVYTGINRRCIKVPGSLCAAGRFNVRTATRNIFRVLSCVFDYIH